MLALGPLRGEGAIRVVADCHGVEGAISFDSLDVPGAPASLSETCTIRGLDYAISASPMTPAAFPAGSPTRIRLDGTVTASSIDCPRGSDPPVLPARVHIVLAPYFSIGDAVSGFYSDSLLTSLLQHAAIAIRTGGTGDFDYAGYSTTSEPGRTPPWESPSSSPPSH